MKMNVSTQVLSALNADLDAACKRVEVLEAELLTAGGHARDTWERVRGGREGLKVLQAAFALVERTGAAFGAVEHMRSVLFAAEAELAMAEAAFNSASEASLEADESLRTARAQRDAVTDFMDHVQVIAPTSDANVLDDVHQVW